MISLGGMGCGGGYTKKAWPLGRWLLLRSLYSGTRSRVLSPDGPTEWEEGHLGVRQGCRLSPLLYSLYINELVAFIKEKLPEGADVQCLLYADDICITSGCPSDLQLALDAAQEFAVRWRFRFNCDRGKSESMTFLCQGEAMEGPVGPTFFLGEVPLNRATSYKYLGVHITPDLSWDFHKQHVIAQARGAAAELIWKGARQQGDLIEPINVVRMFEMITRPSCEYAAEIWGYGALERLEAVQRDVGRRILGCGASVVNEAVEGELGWLPLQARREVALLRLWGRIMNKPQTSLLRQTYQELHRLWKLQLQTGEAGEGVVRQVKNWVAHVRYLMVVKYPVLRQYFRRQSLQGKGQRWGQVVAAAVREGAEVEWRNKVGESRPKLRTYRWVTGEEPLLQPYIREAGASDPISKIISGLRVGTNDLEIERGRWCAPRVPREERVCRMCDTGCMEDERHFLLDCPAYETERREFTQQLDEQYTLTWAELSANQRLQVVLLGPEMPVEMWLDYAGAVGEEKPILRSVRQFVYRAHMRRQAELGGGAGGEDQMVMLEAGGMVG